MEAINEFNQKMEEKALAGEAMRSSAKGLDIGMFIKPSNARQHDVHFLGEWSNENGAFSHQPEHS